MDWSRWYSGWEEREKYNTRQRRDFAKAFETFKKENPYATFNDYQDYIDQMAGGSNYIRGGAPGEDVLRNMANENARNLAAKRAREAHESKMREFRRMKEYQEFAQPFLMGGTPETIGERREQFDKAIGNVSPLVSGMLDNLFTKENYMTEQGKLLLGKVDQAANYLTRVGGDVKDKKQFAQLLGIQEHFAQPLIDMAKTEYDKRKQDHWIDKTGVLENRVLSLAQRGGDIDAFLNDIDANGMFSMPDNVRTNLKSIYDAETDKLNDAESRAAAQAYRDIANSIRQDSNFMLGLSNEGRAETIEKIKNQFINQMSPDQFEKHFGSSPSSVSDDVFVNLADELLRIAQNNQARLRVEDRAAVEGKVTEGVANAVAARIEDGLSQLQKTKFINEETNPKVIQVFGEIASQYYPSAAVQARLFDIASDFEEGSGNNWSVAQLYAKAMQDPSMQRLLKRTDEYSQERVDQALDLQGGYNIDTFSGWADDFADLQEQRIATYKTYPQLIENNALTNFPIPQGPNVARKDQLRVEMSQIIDMVKEYEKYEDEVREKLNSAEVEWNSRRERSQGPKSWIKTGTDDSRWIDTEANDIRDSYTKEYSEMLDAIEEYKETLRKKYSALETEAVDLLGYDQNQRDSSIVRLFNYIAR